MLDFANLKNSPDRRAWMAIGEDEDAAARWIQTGKAKILAFLVGATLAGLAAGGSRTRPARSPTNSPSSRVGDLAGRGGAGRHGHDPAAGCWVRRCVRVAGEAAEFNGLPSADVRPGVC